MKNNINKNNRNSVCVKIVHTATDGKIYKTEESLENQPV